jgi:hypothetical protein
MRRDLWDEMADTEGAFRDGCRILSQIEEEEGIVCPKEGTRVPGHGIQFAPWPHRFRTLPLPNRAKCTIPPLPNRA